MQHSGSRLLESSFLLSLMDLPPYSMPASPKEHEACQTEVYIDFAWTATDFELLINSQIISLFGVEAIQCTQ